MEDHEERADSLDEDVARLEHEAEKVEQEIDEARSDWEAKQEASDVPGAVPDPGEEDETAMEEQADHGEGADEAGQ
jgi:chromosome segregation ATPase